MSTIEKEWISRREATRLLNVSAKAVDRLVEAGKIDVREIPGVWRTYSKASIQAVLDGSVRRANDPFFLNPETVKTTDQPKVSQATL